MYYVHPNMTIVEADSYRVLTGERLFPTFEEAYSFVDAWRNPVAQLTQTQEYSELMAFEIWNNHNV